MLEESKLNQLLDNQNLNFQTQGQTEIQFHLVLQMSKI